MLLTDKDLLKRILKENISLHTQWACHSNGYVVFYIDNFFITILMNGTMDIRKLKNYKKVLEVSFKFESCQTAKEFLYEIDGLSFIFAEINANDVNYGTV